MTVIQSPDDSALDELCSQLEQQTRELDVMGSWPKEQLDLCGQYGVYKWFFPEPWGNDWSQSDIVRGYLKLAQADLTTTFIITQRMGACRRLARSTNEALKLDLLPRLASGELMASVGLSHLTTSRQHLKSPVLKAEHREGHYLYRGFCPWVTGAEHCDYIAMGAALEDGRQLLAFVPCNLPGMKFKEYEPLIALTSSHTATIDIQEIFIQEDWVIEPPQDHISAATGGVESSALALGLSAAAIRFIQAEASKRTHLNEVADQFDQEWRKLVEQAIGMADGKSECTKEQLRQAVNSLTLHATQAALSSAKGAGFVHGHPAGRWVREAFFFLVWSCPQPVTEAMLCEFAWLDPPVI